MLLFGPSLLLVLWEKEDELVSSCAFDFSGFSGGDGDVGEGRDEAGVDLSPSSFEMCCGDGTEEDGSADGCCCSSWCFCNPSGFP